MKMDTTDTACMIAGATALGVIVFSACQKNNKGQHMLFEERAPTACSARVAYGEPISARAAAVEAPKDATAKTTNPLDDLFSREQLSEGFDEQFQGSIQRSRQTDEKVKKAKNEVRAQNVELHNNAKSLGAEVLVPGRCAERSKRPQPKVTGGCMFFQTDAYASALERDMAA